MRLIKVQSKMTTPIQLQIISWREVTDATERMVEYRAPSDRYCAVMYHREVMLWMRKVAIRFLPLLVVVWATLALAGGAVQLVKQADDSYGAAAKAGLGLCAVSVAVMARSRIRSLTKHLWRRVPLPDPALRRPPGCFVPLRRRPPLHPPGPRLLQALQISRT